MGSKISREGGIVSDQKKQHQRVFWRLGGPVPRWYIWGGPCHVSMVWREWWEGKVRVTLSISGPVKLLITPVGPP